MRRIKTVKLVDGNGNKLTRKIRRDAKGLYVINHGRRGTLIKIIDAWDASKFRVVDVVRKVDFYTEIEAA